MDTHLLHQHVTPVLAEGEIREEAIYLLLFIAVPQITNQRDADETKEDTVKHQKGLPRHKCSDNYACVPRVHGPLPVVGHPATRAAAHHRVCHAALLQPAGRQRGRKNPKFSMGLSSEL